MPTVRQKRDGGFTTAVVQYARLQGWAVAHFRAARTTKGWRTPVAADGAGLPDLLLIRDGRMLFVELKTGGACLTDRQRTWAAWLRRAGQDVRTWRPRDWKEILATLQKEGAATVRGALPSQPTN